tara:strand:+ start:54 stop:539 length:486 start_codon:yes stop_codon:yes gene_type:complete
MKKIICLTISFTLLIYINACTGYEPIFSTKNLQLEIGDYSIKGNKILGKQIYAKLYNLLKSNNNNPAAQSINISIEVLKDKTAQVKNSVGKILEYKVSITTNVEISDFLTNDQILSHTFTYSSLYKVEDQYSETIKLENKIIENLINKTYQNLLIKIIEVR